MWADSFLRQQEGLLASSSSQQNKRKTSGLGGTRSEWEMSFREMELVAIQQEENRTRAGDGQKPDIEVDISNSSLSISKISHLETTLAPVIETPPSISLIRIQNKASAPKGDLTSPASILLQSLAQKSPFAIVQSKLRWDWYDNSFKISLLMLFIYFSVKHSCKECGMIFPTEEKKRLHSEVCEDPAKIEIVTLEPPKKKRRPPPALIPL